MFILYEVNQATMDQVVELATIIGSFSSMDMLKEGAFESLFGLYSDYYSQHLMALLPALHDPSL
jgi:hypothetical protein